ncbi:MAG: hypothetical protein O7H41_16335 [Planctomycetota bacterium]|nr:hypothetical protein [Planctomycetota bacterium]
MSNEIPSPDPRKMLGDFRQSYTNFPRLWKTEGRIPEEVKLRSAKDSPITEADLPQELWTLLKEARAASPKRSFIPVKFMNLINGRPVQVVEDEEGLPAEEHLLVLGRTLTMNTCDEARISTDILVVRVD